MSFRALWGSWRRALQAPLALLLAAPVTAAAQTSPSTPPVTLAEQVVVTASVDPVGFDELTRAVQAVFARELERLGITSAADGLRLVAGVDVRARGVKDVQTDFAVRGATFGQSLILVDGWRLNDSQSGHHNGDIPSPVAGIDRIEVVSGPASAVHGADALGGTINIITRRDPHASLAASAGEHGYASVEASVAGRGIPDDWILTGWGRRSSGFTFDRDFALGGVLARGRLAEGIELDVRHLRKAFGANGFYGNSPSKEWTDLTMAAASWRTDIGDWATSTRGLFRNHGDHFRWDINRPGFAENRHRTNAASVTLVASRDLRDGVHLTVGASGGADVIRSSNLGDHTYGQGAGFVEVQTPLGARAALQAGLRFDQYSAFGGAWSPSVSSGIWLTPALRLRASLSHAFRIPTFTERYYSDPAHLASAELDPERGWALDAGADWAADGWLLSASAFRRWDEDVIDWVKAQPDDRWRTTNVRDVSTAGVEASIGRAWGTAVLRVSASSLDVDAPSLDLLSKYVLEYTRHALAVAAAAPIGGGLTISGSVDVRRRFAADTYAVVNLRASRVVSRATIFVDVTNLFDEDYVEIPGVEMPGRWLMAGVRIR